MIGVIKIVWAMIMALGVNKSPSVPKGPDLDRIR
jgi:hypothetical protein